MDLTLYHGSGSLFDKFEQHKARIPNDLWGGGVLYGTDNIEIAKLYASAMSKKTPTHEKFLYTIGVKINHLFDVEAMFTGTILVKFVNSVGVENFARGAKLLSYGADKYKIFGDLKLGNKNLTGAQVFHGITQGMLNTSRGRIILKKMEFDTLRYNGGMISGAKKYSVYLPYYAANVKILNIDIENNVRTN